MGNSVKSKRLTYLQDADGHLKDRSYQIEERGQ